MSILNIKCKYIIKSILDIIESKKLLKIIQYNKQLQEISNKSINNYIELYSTIEIELTLVSNIKEKEKENIFINFYPSTKPYTHIYFNNSKEESQRNYITKDDKFRNVKIVIDNSVKSLSFLFNNCTCIKKIKFTKFCIKDINDMMSLFEDCSSLKEIDFSHFDTSNVTNMSYMFDNCKSLKSLDLSKFNTSKVTLMKECFLFVLL